MADSAGGRARASSARAKVRPGVVGNLSRAADVAAVLVKYGLAGWLSDIEWPALHNALKSAGGEVLASQSFPARVRLAITDLGTTYIKLGQMLSTRPDLVGKELAAELSKLQEHTPPDAASVARQTVENELGRPIAECFRRFDGDAKASASIGQIHRARLKSGRKVVVKVQHPGIEGKVRRDLEILQYLAELAEKNGTLHSYQPVSLVKEFSRTLLNELDFRRELRNLQAFRRNFAEDDTVVFPKPYAELTSGRVLTMARIDGYRLSEARRLDRLEVDRQELARRGADVFIRMIFRDGFYHADPHPGNLMILRDGRIALLDAGMVGRIDQTLRKQIIEILLAAGEQDASRLTDAVLRICGSPDDLDRNALGRDLTEVFEEYGTQSVGQFNMSGALTAVTDVLHDHKLILPGNVSMLIKCLILLEGTSRLLNPKFNLAELLEPWRQKLIREQLSPMHQLKEFRRIYADLERTAQIVPRLIERVEQGKLSIHLEHQHLKSAANRMVVGLFMSALLVASSILLARGVPPLLWGLSAVGMVGYAIPVVFGFRLFWLNRDKLVARRRGDWE